MTISNEQAERTLQNDIARFDAELDRLIKVELDQGQWDSLMSLVSNLGVANLGSSTLLTLLNASDYGSTADQLPQRNWGGGQILAGLTKRRAAERAMFQGAV